jgi:hypothetical protein
MRLGYEKDPNRSVCKYERNALRTIARINRARLYNVFVVRHGNVQGDLWQFKIYKANAHRSPLSAVAPPVLVNAVVGDGSIYFLDLKMQIPVGKGDDEALKENFEKVRREALEKGLFYNS